MIKIKIRTIILIGTELRQVLNLNYQHKILRIQGTELLNVNMYVDGDKSLRICARLEGSKDLKVTRLFRDPLAHVYLLYIL